MPASTKLGKVYFVVVDFVRLSVYTFWKVRPTVNVAPSLASKPNLRPCV